MAEMESPAQQMVVVFSMTMLLLLMSSGTVADIPCDSSGCCDPSNYVPRQESRPLDLTQKPDGYDAKDENEKAFIYHCVQNFTSFRWFKVIHGAWVPYPWGEEGRVHLPEERHNQTIEILRLKKSDEASYMYVASNGTHNVTGEFYLQVDCSGSAFSFATSEQPVQPVRLGSQKTLRCAANKPQCPQPFRTPRLFWEWRNQSSSTGRVRFELLKNNTLPHTSVVCAINQENCTVYIGRVERVHFEGEFICRFYGESYGPPLNETVKFVQIEERTWPWKVVLAVVLPMVGVVAVVAFVSWRCGHRLRFWLRTLPDRGDFDHDAVIVHGEDHEDLARDHLKPGLQDLGYDVMDEVATPGKPEVLEKADAILNSYCVILTFSDRELQESSTRFLTQVTQLKAARTVLFVRCDVTDTGHNDVRSHVVSNGSSNRQNDAAHGSRDVENVQGEVTSHSAMEEGRLLDGRTEVPEIRTENSNTAEERTPRFVVPDDRTENSRNVWKDESLKAFKVLRWPQNASPSNTTVSKTSRGLDKFWYSLRNHLPKPVPSQERVRSAESRGHRQRRDCDSGSSQRPLLSTGSTGRTASQASDCRSPTRGNQSVSSAELGAASRSTGEGQGSGFDQHPQLNFHAASLSVNPASLDVADDVFIPVAMENAGLDDVKLSASGPAGIPHDFVQGRGLPHELERGYSDEFESENLPGTGEDLPAAVQHYRQRAPDAFSPRLQTTHFDSSIPPSQIHTQNLPTELEADPADTSKAGSPVPPRQISAQSVPSKLQAQSFPSLELDPSPLRAFSQPIPLHSHRPELPTPPNSAFPSSALPLVSSPMLYPLRHNNGVASGSGSAMDAQVADSSILAASSLATSEDIGNGRLESYESSVSDNLTGQPGDVDKRREADEGNREQSGPKTAYHSQESGYHSISPSTNQISPRFS